MIAAAVVVGGARRGRRGRGRALRNPWRRLSIDYANHHRTRNCGGQNKKKTNKKQTKTKTTSTSDWPSVVSQSGQFLTLMPRRDARDSLRGRHRAIIVKIRTRVNTKGRPLHYPSPCLRLSWPISSSSFRRVGRRSFFFCYCWLFFVGLLVFFVFLPILPFAIGGPFQCTEWSVSGIRLRPKISVPNCPMGHLTIARFDCPKLSISNRLA